MDDEKPARIVNRCSRPGSLALERGRQFLLAKQGPDGLWRDFLTPAGEASAWPTGFIGTALHVALAETTALARAADTLIVNQNADGGWGYNEEVPTDADSTAWVLLFLALTGHRGDTSIRASACLKGHQRRESGGIATYREPGPIRRYMGVGRWWGFRGWCSPQSEVTALAGRALSALRPQDRGLETAAAWRYVRSRQRPDGSWSAYWWTAPQYATLQAVELARSLGDREPIDRAATWATALQLRDGGWSAPGATTSAFATALSLSILLHAGVSGQPVEQAISWLAALQDEDGGWPSHPIMRIPLPGDTDPDRPRRFGLDRLGRGIVVRDQHRTFTSAACVAALARACQATLSSSPSP